MARRESIELPGFGHANPIPAASRKGPFVYSGAFTGRDPHTRELPADLDTQVANVFRHIRSLMSAVGGSTDDVMKLTVWLVDHRDRDALNREWLAMFPDPASRPARHVVKADLDGGVLVQADVVAILDTTIPGVPT
jgi:enamine deaminase RidA (YjgF/YER057c/UK114 family)